MQYIYASAASRNPHSSLQRHTNWARITIQSASWKCLQGLSITESDLEDLCTQGSVCPAVFRLPQPMATPSILFSYTGGGQSFQGLERPEIPPAPGETRH